MAEFSVWKYIPSTKQDEDKLTSRHNTVNCTTSRRKRKLFLKINKNKNIFTKNNYDEGISSSAKVIKNNKK